MAAVHSKLLPILICLSVGSLPLRLFGVENGMGTNAISNLNVNKSLQSGKGNFLIGTNGDINLIKGVPYAWPSNHNTTNSVLLNDGNGNLTWMKNPEVISFLAPSANAVWNSQPAALTEFMGSTRNRTQVDFSAITQVRLSVDVMVIGAATPASIRAQYSINQTTWRYFDAAQANPAVNINVTGLTNSPWINIESAAMTDAVVRIVGTNGNGTASPAFGMITFQIR